MSFEENINLERHSERNVANGWSPSYKTPIATPKAFGMVMISLGVSRLDQPSAINNVKFCLCCRYRTFWKSGRLYSPG